MIKLYPAIIAIYQQLFRQATINSSYKFIPNRVSKLLIIKFIKWLNANYRPEQLTEDFLIQYFEFAYSQYSGIVTPHGKNTMPLNWLIGPKMCNTWQRRNVNKLYLVQYKINQDFRLLLKNAFVKVNVINSNHYLKVNSNEEQEKQRFYNTLIGYLYCAGLTTLYNAKSTLCAGCNYKAECIIRLANNFPHLYKLRAENDGVDS